MLMEQGERFKDRSVRCSAEVLIRGVIGLGNLLTTNKDTKSVVYGVQTYNTSVQSQEESE